jgi:hypothetical protein
MDVVRSFHIHSSSPEFSWGLENRLGSVRCPSVNVVSCFTQYDRPQIQSLHRVAVSCNVAPLRAMFSSQFSLYSGDALCVSVVKYSRDLGKYASVYCCVHLSLYD